MKTDLKIAQEATLIPIMDLAAGLGIDEDFILPCGQFKAKISLHFFEKLHETKEGKLILVTAMTPTPYGEGKTTVSIGLSMALNKIHKNSIVALREPSLGPVFGIKGGAAGGGYVQVLPMEDINLHFTGDIHAISAAHNLLAAVLDNHMHFGNKLNVDETEIFFKRAMDMNDRSLRDIVVGLGGKPNGPAREDGFIITAASEVMAILALSNSLVELKERLGKILVAFAMNGNPIYAKDFGVHGAMAALLKDALKPNLAQTIDHTPAFIHCGPFANIAHGTCSIVAIKMAQKLCDYTVVEAGFGSDLGAEKFIDIVTRVGQFNVDTAVLVATIRACKLHGGAPPKDLKSGTIEHLKKGFLNLEKHIENMRKFKIPTVVALNIFEGDTEDEIKAVNEFCQSKNVRSAEVRAFQQGADGAVELAHVVSETCEKEPSHMQPLYDLEDPLEKKIEKVAHEIYGAARVVYIPRAEKDMKRIEKLGLQQLPVCIAKTNRSLSDDPKLLGRPENFKITISGINISAGAGFLVPLTGEVMLMPGLSKIPNALQIDVDEIGRIIGLS
ncbi:MAG: formate--tetrahydrofolate ligase [candidate division WOR-3 bacterium]|nr:MAG: formate--tetrahydrofolate ligase [candidate division WOR-3 bacterium]